MSRLTEKVKNTDDYIRLPTKDKQEFINKLGKLEDLEEELGCPLEVIIKALKDGIYNKRGFHYKVILYEDVLCAYPIDVYDESWELSNYKNNWWLKEDRSKQYDV